MKLGDLEFHIISDGHVLLDGGAMFGVIPKPLWEKKAPPDARNRIELAMNCLLIRAGGKRILVETGAGDKMSAKLRDIYGLDGPHLLAALARLRARAGGHRHRDRYASSLRSLRRKHAHGEGQDRCHFSECPVRRAESRIRARA